MRVRVPPSAHLSLQNLFCFALESDHMNAEHESLFGGKEPNGGTDGIDQQQEKSILEDIC